MLEGQRRLLVLGGVAVVPALLLIGAPPADQQSASSTRFVTMLQRLDWSAVMAAEPVANQAAPLDLPAYEAIAEQPLFVPGRRAAPPPAEVVAAAEPTPAPEPAAPPAPSHRFSVAAILIQDGEPLAMLRGPRGKLHRVVREDRVEGWMVAAIEPRKIILRYEDQTDELTLGPRTDGSGAERDNR